MKTITSIAPDSLYNDFVERMKIDKAGCDYSVSIELSQCLHPPFMPCSTFSTSVALIDGLYRGQSGARDYCFMATSVSEFLQADFSRDPNDDRMSAERNHQS